MYKLFSLLLPLLFKAVSGMAQGDIDGFFLINEKYSIQAGDTIPEIDTICVGDPFSIAFHIGGAQKVNSVYFMVNGRVINNYQASNLVLYEAGSYSFDGEADVIDKWGNRRVSPWGFVSLVVIHCPPTTRINGGYSVCQNQCVQATNTSTNYPTTYEWRMPGGNPQLWSDSLPPPICYADTGTFPITLIVNNPAGADTAIQYVTVTPAPAPIAVPSEFQIKEGDEVTLEACARGSTYQWQPAVAILQNQDTLLTVQPDETQNYTCTIATANGCTTACQYTVKVQSGLLLPTAFSPNGDGVNDIFRILNTNITLKNFEIYNRWGELVFKTSDIQAGWDGVYKGVEQELGVYVWRADYVVTKSGKRKTAKGNVTLIR